MKKLNKSVQRPKFWWEGGTLHKKQMRHWYKATIANKMATLADMVVNMKDHKDAQSWGPNISYTNPNDLLVNYVAPLMAGIDAMGNDPDLNDIAIEVAVLTMAKQLGFITLNPIEERIKRENELETMNV